MSLAFGPRLKYSCSAWEAKSSILGVDRATPGIQCYFRKWSYNSDSRGGRTARIETNQVVVRSDDTLDSATKPKHPVYSRASRASGVEQDRAFVRGRVSSDARRESEEGEDGGAGFGVGVVQRNLEDTYVRCWWSKKRPGTHLEASTLEWRVVAANPLQSTAWSDLEWPQRYRQGTQMKLWSTALTVVQSNSVVCASEREAPNDKAARSP